MFFCTNCGTTLIQNAKFCPACGTNVLATKMSKNPVEKHSNENDTGRKIVPKPERGRANNLFKDKAQDFIKEKAQNYVKEKAQGFVSKNSSQSENSTKQSTINNNSQTQNTENKNVSNKNGINKWTWIYIIINALLMILGSQSDKVMGVLIFSVLILAIVFFRRKKEKPYNWLVKIILVVQLILLFALIAESIEYISIFTLVFMGLLLANLALLFKGNN